jgi:hypothetical protein
VSEDDLSLLSEIGSERKHPMSIKE